MKNSFASYGDKPNEYLRSVDLALLLINTLRDVGEVRISTAAKELGVSQSTIHRAMAMLIYRGFATQSPHRTYVAGPALNALTLRPRFGNRLFEATEPHLKKLAVETGETCQLSVTKGRKTHIIATVEGTKLLRVGHRKGRVMPSEFSSGGQATLAHMSAAELRSLYHDLSDEDFKSLRRRLQRARDRGFSVNSQLVEPDISAIGATLHNDLGDILGAISVSIPTMRFQEMSGIAAEALLRTTRDLNKKLASFELEMPDLLPHHPH